MSGHVVKLPPHEWIITQRLLGNTGWPRIYKLPPWGIPNYPHMRNSFQTASPWLTNWIIDTYLGTYSPLWRKP